MLILSGGLLATSSPPGIAREPTYFASLQKRASSRMDVLRPAAATAGGDTCATSHVISSLPFNDSGNTSVGASNEPLVLNTTCAGGGAVTRPGPDLVYQLTVGTGSSLTFTLTPEAKYDPTLYILGTCTSGSTCIQESDTAAEGGVETIGPRTFSPGIYYLYVDSIYTADETPGSGAYTLMVTGTLGTPNNSSFYTLTPCRVIDTRGVPGVPIGGPAITGTPRTFALAGLCGIPADAKSLSVNVTVTQPAAQGHLIVYPGGSPVPGVSTLNFRAGQTRANNAIVPLGTGVTIAAVSSTTTHFILDVNGYFK
jgi:hypothetical protein